MENIKRGITREIISLSEDESRITYFCSRKYSTSFKNPEEKVRASYFVELIEDYNYTKERIDLEVIIPRRKPEDRADIVVYEDDELKKPYLVVECKKDRISDAEFEQAIEQAFGNANSLRAKFASVVAGTTRTAFDIAGFKPSEREKNVISDIPKKYGRTPKYKFIKGSKDKDLRLVSKEDLIRTLEKTHDTVWQGGKLAPTTAFDEVSKLLFCKLQDEKESTITKRGDPYKFQIGSHETPEEVFKRIDKIYQSARQKDSEVFKEDIKLDPKVIYAVVEHLQSINFNKTDLDTKGVAFERFMEDFFKGKMGQFFTPREIIRFCVKMLNPQTDQLVLDPACGSGGFLLNAMDFIRDYADKEYEDDPVEAYRMWHDFAKDNIYGIEINDQIARVCKMNMIIHDDGHTNIISTDALREIKEINNIHKKFKANKFDLLLTNPPFGAKVKESEKPYLQKFNLGKDKKTQRTEILFIERCLGFLKPGIGKMAIVLPDGILTNSSLQYVRDFIVERAQILAVVSLPQFAFSHFGAGVKSSLVFLRKKREKERATNYPIFMGIAEHIGYDATGRKDPINDLDKILKEYRKFEEDPRGYKGFENGR
ncbi:restriction endonuclease subunit M [candidate division WOR-3 bacterium]|nr:restriction endonuclease subunit M [candidate division WOR-3 bacterium]